MKRLLALCLSSCLALPTLLGPTLLGGPVLTASLPVVGGLAVLATASPVMAEAEVIKTASKDAATDHDGDHDHEGDHGDEHDAHSDDAKTPILSFDFGSAFWNLVIFVGVLSVLSIFVWPNVLHGLQAREEKIREDLESAEKANADAQSILAGYQTKLDEAATQVQRMLADARRDAETNGQKIVEQAKIEAAAQRERAVADIENAKKVAMAELASQTSDMAMKVARSVVGRELSSDDHADLIKQAMERLPSQN